MRFFLPSDELSGLFFIITLIIITISSCLFQILVIILGSILSPAIPELLIPNKTEPYVETYCSFGYGFIAACAYNTLIVLACCYYAFRTRRVPDNYNESKFIAISVYSTSVVFLSIVPVYSTSNSALYKVAVLCLALLVNAYLNLICVYFIKLYAVRFVDPDEMVRPGTLGTMQAITGPTGGGLRTVNVNNRVGPSTSGNSTGNTDTTGNNDNGISKDKRT